MDKYLGTASAAEYLGLAARTLERWRITSAGPPYRKFGGRILYSVADLEAWAETKRHAPEKVAV